jgi:hypothetical protein
MVLRFNRSSRFKISLIPKSDRRTTLKTSLSPSSMRFAISTSPSRETASVSYNPFRSPHFHDRTTGRSLVRAARVRFFADGRAVAFRPEFLP